jgi:hypothetical protein
MIMKKLLFILLICIISLPAFAVTGDISVEGRLDVVGSADVSNIFTTSNIAVGTKDATPAKLNVVGGAKLTGVVTAAAFYGTFERTYTGISQKGAAFNYPYSTSELHFKLPHNASITSVEVYCGGGTSLVGRVDIGASNWSGTANAGTYVVATGSALPLAYTAYTDIKFTTPTVTGAVNGATIMIYFKRTP